MSEDHFLNDLWLFYFHDPYNNDWNLNSYVKLYDVSTAENFWEIHETFKDKMTLGMFFIMREHVFPCWDDPYNKDGGCLSIKVLKQDVKVFWEEICIKMLGETLLRTGRDMINGLSISPKKHFCIIKIWLRSNDNTDASAYEIPKGFYGDIIYKANCDNIENQFNPALAQSPA